MTGPQRNPRDGRVTHDMVRTIREAFDLRATVRSDRELADAAGISVPMVRAIGKRKRYRHVPD